MKSFFAGLVCFFALVSYQGKCQSDLHASYIVTNSGDTIQGIIKEKKWDVTPQKIAIEINGKSKKFRPLEILSFTVNNRTFVSAYVKVDISNHMPGTLDLDDPDPKYEHDSIFFELLIGGPKFVKSDDGKKLGGPKHLYRYKSPGYKLHFYIAESADKFEPLVFKEFFVYQRTSSIKVIVQNEEYKKQLTKFLSSCLAVMGDVQTTGYADDQMLSLFIKYYDCMKL